MKKVFIGALVGAVIFFAFQTIMWMGGFNKNFYSYTPNQDTIMQTLSANIPHDGMYMMPMADPNSADFKAKQELIEKTMPGNPWTMVFYHQKMADFSPSTLLLGLLFSFLSAFFVGVAMFTGKLPRFGCRLALSMFFALFALIMGPLSDINWWSFPWSFVQPKVIDLLIGWLLCSIWLAWYIKPKPAEQA